MNSSTTSPKITKKVIKIDIGSGCGKLGETLTLQIVIVCEFLKKIQTRIVSSKCCENTASNFWDHIARGLIADIEADFYEERAFDYWFWGLDLTVNELSAAFYALLNDASNLRDKPNKINDTTTTNKESKLRQAFAKLVQKTRDRDESDNCDEHWTTNGIVRLRFLFLVTETIRKYGDAKTWNWKSSDDDLKRETIMFMNCFDENAPLFAEFKVVINTLYFVEFGKHEDIPLPPLTDTEITQAMKHMKKIQRKNMHAIAKVMSSIESKMKVTESGVRRVTRIVFEAVGNDASASSEIESETDESEYEDAYDDGEETEVDTREGDKESPSLPHCHTASGHQECSKDQDEGKTSNNDEPCDSVVAVESHQMAVSTEVGFMLPEADEVKIEIGERDVNIQMRRRQLSIEDFMIVRHGAESIKLTAKSMAKAQLCKHTGCPAPAYHYRDWKKEGYKCICGQKFRKLEFLDKHARRGQEIATIKCDKCNFKSNRKCCMNKHVMEQHDVVAKPSKATRRLYECQRGCGELFWTKRQLFDHNRFTQRSCNYKNVIAVTDPNRFNDLTPESWATLKKLASLKVEDMQDIVKRCNTDETSGTSLDSMQAT